MKNCIFLLFALSVILSSCVSERKWVTKEAKIVDITYYCEPVFYKDGTYKSETLAYFVLENGVKVPMPKNFNPSLPEQYIGKTMTYTYSSNVKMEESSILQYNFPSTSTSNFRGEQTQCLRSK